MGASSLLHNSVKNVVVGNSSSLLESINCNRLLAGSNTNYTNNATRNTRSKTLLNNMFFYKYDNTNNTKQVNIGALKLFKTY